MKLFTPVGAVACLIGLVALEITTYNSSDPEQATEPETSVTRSVDDEDRERPQRADDTERMSTQAHFADGVYGDNDIRIEITDVRKIAVGEEGNEYGDVPVLAFWYDFTNKNSEPRDPLYWIYRFDAIQDNDPNFVNTLNVGSLPDQAFSYSQTQNVKQGGTVQNAIAYKLDDETTPIELVATDPSWEKVGSQFFEVK